ncbi:hypothetical protein FKM82_006298 [Ascaphus truei]
MLCGMLNLCLENPTLHQSSLCPSRILPQFSHLVSLLSPITVYLSLPVLLNLQGLYFLFTRALVFYADAKPLEQIILIIMS